MSALLGVTLLVAAGAVWTGCDPDEEPSETEPSDSGAQDTGPVDDTDDDTAPPVMAQPPLEPHPALGFATWRDDELFAVTGLQTSPQTGTAHFVETWEASGDLRNLTKSPVCAPALATHTSQLVAAPGRVTAPDHDQIVIVRRSTDLQVYEVQFSDAKRLPDCLTDSGLGFQLGRTTVPGMTPTPAIAPPGVGVGDYALPDLVDVSVGDLDRREDASGAMRDEVVVAYASKAATSTAYTVTVAVLDWTDASSPGASPIVYPSVVTQTGTLAVETSAVATSTLPVPTLPLTVATADFNGDGRQEIAVAYLTGATQLTVDVFAYSTTVVDGVATHALTKASTITTSATTSATGGDASKGFTPTHWSRGFDAVVGDFDADGDDDLVVGATVEGRAVSTSEYASALDLQLFRLDGALVVAPAKKTLAQAQYASSATGMPRQPLGLQLAPGLLRFDASTGNVGTSQLAYAFSQRDGLITVGTMAYGADLTTAQLGSTILGTSQFPTFSLTSGGLKGLRQLTGNPNDVVWSLALGVWDAAGYKVHLFETNGTTGATGPVAAVTMNAVPITGSALASSVFPLVAFDADGDSVLLGAPVHMTLESVTQTQAIIQEPPKHSYWDPEAREIVSITRDANTFAELKSEGSTSFRSSSESQAASSFGTSTSATAWASAGSPGFIFSAKASASITATVAYDYESSEESLSSHVATESYGASIATTFDDAVAYTAQTFDIWRYRVYGAQALDEGGQPVEDNTFMEILVPRETPKQSMLGGLSVASWYQPLHENGNILSYPLTLVDGLGELRPADMGPVRLPCPTTSHTGCVEDDAGVWWVEQFDPLGTWSGAFDGTTTEQWVSMENSSGDAQQAQYSKKLSGSTEVSASAEVKMAGVFSAGASATVEFSGSGSWSGMETQETTTSSTRGVKLVLGPQVPSQAYDYESVLYVTEDGTLKLAFATDPLGNDSGDEKWISLYGGGPDPALNLPLRFDPVNGGLDWKPNVLSSRSKIRGFFLRESAPDPVTGQHALLGRAIRAGETVRLEVRVNNYTLSSVGAVQNLVVQFEAAPVDAQGNPLGARVLLGRTTIPRLDPRQIAIASLDWNTDGAAYMGTPGATQRWRVFVALDPDDAIPNEIYETEDPIAANRPYCAGAVCVDPGQNNEGWGEVDVMTPIPGAPRHPTPGYGLEEDDIAAISVNGQLKRHFVQARFGQPMEILVTATGDTLSSSYREVRLYDGDPDAGGQLIGEADLHVGALEGSHAWLRWVPLTEGQHELFARIEAHEEDLVRVNEATLRVQVHKLKGL